MYKEVAIMWKNKESYVDYGGVFGLSIIKHVTLQKIVAVFCRHMYGIKRTYLFFIRSHYLSGPQVIT